jgi:hypothetical protein
VEQAVRLILRLAAGDADDLSGHYISIEDNLDLLVRHAAELHASELHVLRVGALQKDNDESQGR